MTSTRAPYSLISAFTLDPFGGNPAAVIFIPNPASASADYLSKIATNLNQPILSVVSSEPLPSDEKGVVVHSVRYFTATGREVPICGHGTLAASKVIFSSPKVRAEGIHTIHFKTKSGDTIKAVQLADDFVEIEIPASDIRSATLEETVKVKMHLNKAFGRDVLVKDIKIGNGTYADYVMVELDISEDLAGSSLDVKQLIGNGFVVNALTAQASNSDAVFVSRMFAPSAMPEPGEDHVCGSIHALLVPHWYTKLGIPSREEAQVKQVSRRGGQLRVVWEQEEGRVKVRGQCVFLASGELHL